MPEKELWLLVLEFCLMAAPPDWMKPLQNAISRVEKEGVKHDA